MNAKFLKNPNWKTSTITRYALALNVPRIKVYKWHYDLVKKIQKNKEPPAFMRADLESSDSDKLVDSNNLKNQDDQI